MGTSLSRRSYDRSWHHRGMGRRPRRAWRVVCEINCRFDVLYSRLLDYTLSVDLVFRVSSLARYLWVYGFSSKGLRGESRNDEASSPRE